MPPSDFAKVDVANVVEQLTLDEQISLIAGVGFWHTHAVPRLNIPAVKVSDGPNGVRGNHFFMGTPAKCLPSATALGATWDVKLINTAGEKLLAAEAKLRSASVLLAPTCNIQRSPLGGRSFESFSEDPHLSGMIAAAYVNGVQAEGIATAIKHFATNDKENDRMAYDSIVSARALREIYLMPFMLAEKYAKPWSYMTAYNRVNGTHLSENPKIMKDVLRDEWKSDAMIMSDWFGVYSISESINAGLDLEMPGTNKWRTFDKVARSIQSRKITARVVKARATKVLEFVQRCAKGAPEVLDGDGLERTEESEADTKLMRKLASESIVLLKNQNDVLPLKPTELKKVAILGGNAKAVILSGGGSASLKPSYFITPYDGIISQLGKDVEVTYSEGARTFKTLPTMDFDLVTDNGEKGWIGSWYNTGEDGIKAVGEPVHTQLVDETRAFFSSGVVKGLTHQWALTLKGKLRPRSKDVKFEFGLTVAGRAKLYVDGNLVVDNWTRQTHGESFFGSGTVEERGIYQLKANISHDILVEYVNVSAKSDVEDERVQDSNAAVSLGGAEVIDSEETIQDAITLAKEADVAIVVVGLGPDWETEGYDRTTLALPGRTDELVQKVAEVNKNTIVVTQSGSAVTMPWVDSVAALVHSWYLGNATGDAIADVLFGKVNPSGKLSLTFPKRLEDTPSFGHFHSENGTVRYAEDLFVGYKHYQNIKIAPLFPFGYGLSYTTFSYDGLSISKPTSKASDISITVSLKLTNTGSLPGSEVVQLYVSYPTTSELTHVPWALKSFDKVQSINPGETREVKLELDKYAVSYWEERFGVWVAEAGEYGVRVGPSSETAALVGSFVVDKATAFEWNGL